MNNATHLRIERKEKWFKENGPCRECGSWEKLECDHIDLTTKDSELKKGSSRIWDWEDTRS